VSNVVQTFFGKVVMSCRIVLRRRWLMLGAALCAAAVGALGVSVYHDRYEATARVYVDTQTVLKPLMESLTFQPDIEQQVSMLARTLISRPHVEKLVAQPGLDMDAPDAVGHERVVSRLMKDIKIVPAGAGNLYDISYRGPNPDRARRVVEATVNLFVESGSGAKRRDSEEAGRFIDEQIHTYEGKLTEAENRLKDFKIRNFGVTGVSNQDYFARVSALTEETSKLRVDLAGAERSRDSFKRELSGEDPQLPIDVLSGSGADAVLQSRIDEQRKALGDLLSKYTDQHPDVVNARRALAQLEAESRRQKSDALKAGGLPHVGAATSPVYQKLRISLAEAEAQVASLRSQLQAKQALLDETRAAAGRQPQAEAELAQLNRDYDIIRKNYDIMVARRESAALGVKLDESSQLAEFRVVEPPRVQAAPVFPSRVHLSLIAVLLSLVAGIAAALAADMAKPTINDRETLRLLSGRPVLGTVSLFITPDGAIRQRASTLRFALAVGVLLIAQSGWVVWTYLHSHPA
jgi:polysaccharide chain length determinant protein (PEP-CTERM system associated)